MVVPFQVVMLPLKTWFSNLSGVIGIPILHSYQGIIFSYIGFGAPLSIFLFHGFIKSIPEELEEAAWIDGCTRPSIFFRVILPLLKPISITVLILNGLWIWNDYLLPMIVLDIGQKVQTLPLAVQNFASSRGNRWDLILPAALMAMTPIIIVYLFCQKYIVKGMTEGAIK
jgi:raffinose/stachyose/melibiose transport system permease protein